MKNWMRAVFLGLALAIGTLVGLATAQPAGNAAGAAERVDVLIGFQAVPGPAEHALVRGQGGRITRSFRIVPAVAANIPANAWDPLQRTLAFPS